MEGSVMGQEWDANGNPIPASSASSGTEWDANGKPLNGKPMGLLEHFQKAVDLAASPQPLDPNQPAWAQHVASGMVRDTLEPIAHPWQTIKAGLTGQMSAPVAGYHFAKNLMDEYRDQGLAATVEREAGGLGAQVGLGALGGEAINALRLGKTAAPIYTPDHAAAFEGAIAPATAMGKTFIPQNVTPEALPAIRSTAARMVEGTPIEQGTVKAATSSSTPPLQRLGAYQKVVKTALNDLEQQHAPALAQNASMPVDTSAIVQELQSKISPTMDTADVSAIKNLIMRVKQAKTLGDLNTFRQELNQETAPEYDKVQIKQGSNVSSNAANALADSVRDAYYDNLQKATGFDFRSLKMQESNLLTTLRSLQNQEAPLAKAEASFNAPSTAREKIGNIANVVKDPKTAITQTILRESPATRLSELLRKSLTELPPAPSSTGVPGPPVPGSTPPQIPAQTGGAYPMPGQVPYAPNMTPGEQVAALTQYLRRRQQTGLPVAAQPIQLPPPK